MFDNAEIDPESFPKFETVSFHPLDRKAPFTVLIKEGLILVAAIVVYRVAVGYGVTVDFLFDLAGYWPFILLFAVTLGIAIAAFVAHSFKGYALREHDVLYKQGVFFRRQTVLPFVRVQHIETHQDAIERFLGLSVLRFYSAGGSAADIKIEGLPTARAEEIRALVLAYIEREQGRNHVGE